VGDAVEHMDVSPSGKRALFEARGNVYTVPAEHGPVRPLTRTSGAAERHATWSPDGEEVAYFSDASGEYQLVVAPADGRGEPRTVTSLGPGYRYTPQWGPRSERVVWVDDTKTIRMADVANGEVTTLGEVLYPFHQGLAAFRVSWSPDGRWIAWDRGLENGHGAVFLRDTEKGESHRVTSEFYDHSEPVFGADGDYLFLRTNRRHEAIYSDLDNSWIYANTTRIGAVPLREDVASPLAPWSDEETGADDADDGGGDGDGEAGEDGGADGGDGGNGRDAGAGEPEPVEIDLEGFERRMVLLPVEAGNYGRLSAVPGKVLYHRGPRTGSGDEEAPLVLYDLEEREEKTILPDVDAYRLSASGKKLLVRKDGRHHIVDVRPDQKLEEPLKTGEMTAELDPRAEWRQIFADAWRLYRDYFYDPGMHGVDWDGLRERYGSLVDDAATRADVNFLIGELIAELNASHTYRGGGDLERGERRAVGLLGVDWALERGAYRIDRVVDGAPWDVETRSPLAEPGVDVSEGDWVLAVNGVPLDTSKDPWAAFEGLAGETVELTVNDRPTADGARTVLVETLREDGDDRLRYLDWIDEKRRRVEELSDGRVGYVYVPNTAFTGQTELVRQFRAQVEKDALVIDERFNSGGQLADRFLELMGRRMYAYIAPRHGAVIPSPPVAHTGPQVMLINGWSGSGGDAFPWYFRTADRGPIVGTRTWGGLIGPAVGHELVDGGVVVIPPARLYGPDGEWFAEGHGVEPDIRVENDPASLAAGGDPQLERAVEEMLRALEEQGAPERPERPPFVERVPGGG
jgi:tricorn protease